MSSVLSRPMTEMIQLAVQCCPAAASVVTTKTTPYPLRALKLTPMQPEWHHSGASTLTRLQRIERIEVVASSVEASSATGQEYTINIYHEQTHSRIPTVVWSRSSPRRAASTSIRPRTPDLQVVHNAGQFCSLRNLAHSCIATDDHAANCDACQRLRSFMTHGNGRPLAFVGVALHSVDNSAQDMVTDFLRTLLDACQAQPESNPAHGCRGQRRVALALQDFLFRL